MAPRRKRPVIPPPAGNEPAQPLENKTIPLDEQAKALAAFREETTPVLINRKRKKKEP